MALSALQNTPDLDGNVYFISQDEPVQLWEFINQVLTRSGLDPITRKVPYAPAYTLAHLFELGARLCGNRFEPRLTRFIVSEMATDHYFDISAARKDLGFAPSVSIAEGLDRTFGCTATTSAAQPRKVA